MMTPTHTSGLLASLMLLSPLTVLGEEEPAPFVAIVSCDQKKRTIEMKVLRNDNALDAAVIETQWKNQFMEANSNQTTAVFEHRPGAGAGTAMIRWVFKGKVMVDDENRVAGKWMQLRQYLQSIGIDRKETPNKPKKPNKIR